jgi:2'-5' RNA ligase
MPRLFVCVWIPEDIKHNIIKFQEKLNKLPMDIKLVEKENLHLTVTFLGDVEEEKINNIKMMLENSIKGMKEFHVKLRELKIIPSESYIKVIGVNVVDENDLLKKIIRNVGGTIGGSYYETTKMTLCRVRNISNMIAVRDFLDENRDISFGEFIIKKISLVKSKITGHGPVYETIHDAMLG